MDNPAPSAPDPDADAPLPHDEAAVRAMLHASRRDIAAGRVAPAGPVLQRMRAVAADIRQSRTTSKAKLRQAG
jgi:hypothetical protein